MIRALTRHAPPARVGIRKQAAFYLGRRRNAYIEGLSLDESDALLDETAHATQESFTAAPMAVGDPFGTIAARCIAATPSIRRPAG